MFHNVFKFDRCVWIQTPGAAQTCWAATNLEGYRALILCLCFFDSLFPGADPIRPSEADSGRRWLLVRGEKEGFAVRSGAGFGRLDMLINLASGDLLLTRVLLKSGLKMGGQRRMDYRGMNAVTYKKISD